MGFPPMPVPHSSPWLRFQSPRVEQASSTGSFTATAGSARCCSIPDIGDDYLTAPATRATLTLA